MGLLKEQMPTEWVRKFSVIKTTNYMCVGNIICDGNTPLN